MMETNEQQVTISLDPVVGELPVGVYTGAVRFGTSVTEFREGSRGLEAGKHKLEEGAGPFSPLTPALSPLRGEGEARAALGRFTGSWRTPSLRSSTEGARARFVVFDSPASRVVSPSPLNGERAGVRGEAVRKSPQLQQPLSRNFMRNLSKTCRAAPA
jgi:hypothetical protein